MIRVPKPETLAKYGLTEEDWGRLYASQGGVCGVCGKAPSTGRFYIDHEHAKNWSSKPPEERRKHVRGLLCYMDNRFFLARGATVERLERAADYLRLYSLRRPNGA